MIPFIEPNGTTRQAITTVANEITGEILNIILVVSLYTEPFLNNRITSFTGCSIDGPFLPEAILLVFIIIPVKKKLQSRINNILNMLQIV